VAPSGRTGKRSTPVGRGGIPVGPNRRSSPSPSPAPSPVACSTSAAGPASTCSCAAVGLEATGVDIAAAAISAAEHKAHERGLTARFLRHDVRRLADLGESFDTVLDSGLLVHVIDDEQDRTAYLHGLQAVMPSGGRYFVLCFSGPQANTEARHLMREDITACFAESWHIDSIEATILDSLTDEDGIPAWLIALTRT
jgi:SAM-dependent methyltransferase